MKLHKVLTNECLLWILPIQGRIQDLSAGGDRFILELKNPDLGTNRRAVGNNFVDSKRVKNND